MSDNQYALTRRVAARPHTVLVSPALLDSIAQDAQNDADLAAEGHEKLSDNEIISWSQADGFGMLTPYVP